MQAVPGGAPWEVQARAAEQAMAPPTAAPSASASGALASGTALEPGAQTEPAKGAAVAALTTWVGPVTVQQPARGRKGGRPGVHPRASGRT
eukprot:15430169-Alexandrium_andersonii.AAC.1